MADSFSIDSSDLGKLAADLGEVSKGSGKFVRKAVEVSARHVKDDARKNVGGTYFRHIPRAIDYDVEVTGDGIEAEVGVRKGRTQSRLAAVAEYGSPTLAPVGFMRKALESNAEDFERGLTAAIEDALKESGL